MSVNGVRKAGICPFNKNRFSQYDLVIGKQRERTLPPDILQNNEEVTLQRKMLTEQPQCTMNKPHRNREID